MRSALISLIATLVLTAPALAGQEIIGAKDGKDIVTVRNVEVTRFLTVRTTLFAETGGIV